MIYLLSAVGLTPGGSSTVHIYTQTVHRTTQLTNWEECAVSVFASYTLAFALKPREKHGKTSVKVENLSQGRKISVKVENLSQGRRTSVRVEILSQSSKTSVRVEEPQSG